MSESRTVRRRFGTGRRGVTSYIHSTHLSTLAFCKSGFLAEVLLPQGPVDPALCAPGGESQALSARGSFGGETDWSEGPSGLSWRPYLWGWRRLAGRGAVQSAGLGHVSCAGPARPALPGFKGPCSAKLPSPPPGPAQPCPALASRASRPLPRLGKSYPTCPLAVRPP